MRKICIEIGNFLDKTITFNNILGIILSCFAILGSTILTQYISKNNPSISPIQLIIVFIGFFFGLVLCGGLFYGVIKASGKLFLWIGDYYPDWYYFPRIGISLNQENNNINLLFINPKRRQIFSLQAFYIEHQPLKGRIHSILPGNNHLLIPTATTTGREELSITIGRIENGNIVVTRGPGNEIVIFDPGVYEYQIQISGRFRNRNYTGRIMIIFTITNNHQVSHALQIINGRGLYIIR